MITNHQSQGGLLNGALCAFALGVGISACTASSPYAISNVISQDSETAVYLTIDTARAELPWTVRRSEVRAATGDGRSIEAKAFSLKGELAAAFETIVLQRGDQQNPLRFEFQGPGDALVQIQTVPQAPKPGEIAFLFEASRDQLRTLSVVLPNGQPLSIEIPASK